MAARHAARRAGARSRARYPLVELADRRRCSRYVGWRFGAEPVGARCWCGFCAALVALAGIDWDTTLLPDDLTLPLLWAGLRRAAALRLTISAAASGLGAVAGYLVAVVVYWAVQAHDRQGRHGLRRLQAARRARRLARLEDDPADRARRLGDRRDRRHRHEDVVRACAKAATSRSARSSPAPGWSSCFAGPDRVLGWLRWPPERRSHGARMARLRIGLTGGIGSGKSTVGAMLASIGAVVIDTDLIARCLTSPGGAAIEPIARCLRRRVHRRRRQPRPRRACGSPRSPTAACERASKPSCTRSSASEVERDAQAAAVEAPALVFDVPLLVESGRWRELRRCGAGWSIATTRCRSIASLRAPAWTAAAARAVIAQQASRRERRAGADAVHPQPGALARRARRRGASALGTRGSRRGLSATRTGVGSL